MGTVQNGLDAVFGNEQSDFITTCGKFIKDRCKPTAASGYCKVYHVKAHGANASIILCSELIQTFGRESVCWPTFAATLRQRVACEISAFDIILSICLSLCLLMVFNGPFAYNEQLEKLFDNTTDKVFQNGNSMTNKNFYDAKCYMLSSK